VGQAAVRAVLVVKLNVASQDANELVATDDQLLAEVEQGLGRLATKPVLIVWGDKDPGSKERHRLRWEHTFPNHRTHILRGASHYIQEDAPEEIVAAIKAWWPGPASGE
jgi:haloalkane dehalogenase